MHLLLFTIFNLGMLISIQAQTLDIHSAQQDTLSAQQHDEKYCKKGVIGMMEGKAIVVEYELAPKFSTHFRENNIENKVTSNQYTTRWRTKFKLPLVNKPSLKMAIGFKYSREEFEFNEAESGNGSLFDNLNNKPLKSAGTALYFFKAFNHKYYFSMRGDINFNGDYSGFIKIREKYLTYSFGGIFAFKKNAFTEYGIGLQYANYFGRNSIYPVFVYNKTFSNKWGLEISLPVKAMLRYNASKNTLFYAGVSGGTANYAVNVSHLNGNANQLLHFRNLEGKISASIEQKLYSIFWMGLQAGYRMNLSSQIRDISTSNRKLLESSAPYGSGAFVNASLYIAISKEMIEKRTKSASTPMTVF